jgi:type II secretory pathway pseudopilin PulG
MSGFSLVEMAIVIVIITLLLGAILVPLGTQADQRKIDDAKNTLDNIRQALIGYAVANGYLPCPDETLATGIGTPNDGVEDRDSSGNCQKNRGNVPWSTLGTSPTDPWGNRYFYAITPEYAQRSPAFNLDTPNTLNTATALRVCSATPCSTPNVIADKVPAIVMSYGKNGYGAINGATGTQNSIPGTISANENENVNNDNVFISRSITFVGDTTSGVQEFDDIATWLSPYILLNRMIAAGKLP